MLLALLAGGAWLLLSGQDEAPAVEKRAAPVTQQQVETAASEAERTLRRMKGLARSVRIWMIKYGAGFDPEQVTMQRMQQDLAIKPAEMNDAWGRPLGYQPEGSEFSILSAGADGQFGNSDDLRLTEKARK